MNEYDWNKDLFNEEPVKPEGETAAEEAVNDAVDPVGAVIGRPPEAEAFDDAADSVGAVIGRPPEAEAFDDAADSVGAVIGRPPEAEASDDAADPVGAVIGRPPEAEASDDVVGADAYIGPRNDPQPSYAEQPVQNARPTYNDYYYSSGPAYTARPDQTYRPAYQAQTSAQPQTREIKAEKQRSGGFWKKAVALALVCCLLGGAAGLGGSLLGNRLSAKNEPAASNSGTAVQVAAPRESTELSVITVDSGKLMTASQVYKANVNSTVGITTEITTTNWWGYQSTAAAAGSGFILTEDGYILTNEHVIEDANTITVTMYDGTKYPATLIGYDVSNDIAVLKIDAKGLTPVTLGSSDSLEVGDEVIAIGNPLGELTFSLTKGNVSALNRAVTLSSGVTMTLIQTDAAINSGNSGGALFNMYGEVVGITNAKYSSSGSSSEASIDNIGFAIPINSVREIVTSIIEKGYISSPYIGVTIANVSEESQSYGMPKGAAIRSVEQGGPAEQGGLRANDIVTAVNGETIESYEDLKKIVSDSEPGDKLNFTVYRQGETVSLTVTVGEKTQSALPNQQSSQQSGQSQSGQSQDGQGQNGQGQNPWGGSGSDGSGANPWGGQDGQGQSGQNPWGGSGSDGSDGSGSFPWGDSDPWSWFFGGGYDSGNSNSSDNP